MEELTNVHFVALWGFVIAVIFGFVANKTNFCTMGAISDVVNIGTRGRLGAWCLAIGIAVIGAQSLSLLGLVDLSESRHLTANFGWLGYLLGGFLFGVGMTLAAGCGQRNLVRFGGGNLKALVVLLIMGITAYMTVRGLFGLVRVDLIEVTNVDLSDHGLADQSIVTMLQVAMGLESSVFLRALLAAVVGLAFVAYAVRQPSFRESRDDILAGIVVGAAIVAAWYVTGVVGNDDFDPVTVEGMSFVASTGNTLNYLMTFTGSTVNFGIAIVLGLIVGSFVYAIFTGNFRVETFSNRSDMLGHLGGAVLMGFGGVVALGCTIGQGVTGLSTLALGSVIALLSIVFGSVLTMKVQYYLLDEIGIVRALFSALGDFVGLGSKTE